MGHLYGTVPAENMSDKQRQAIGLIEKSLQIHFNGRTMKDVSTFIGLFKETSMEQARKDSYDPYMGLDGFDLSTDNRNLRVPFFFAGFLVIQFPGELVELVDDSHLGVEDLVEAVSHEVGILVGSVTTVDEILEGVDDQVVHGDALVLGDVLDTPFHTAGDGDVEFLFRGC